MKNLIIIGSPRKKGESFKFKEILLDKLKGQNYILETYKLNIRPCIDCRYCWNNHSCIIDDDMSQVYKLIDESDNIIFISPIYFYSITASLKLLIDRLQVYWARDRGENNLKKHEKTGAYILIGGAKSFKNQFLGGELVLKSVFKEIGIKDYRGILMANSDRVILEDNIIVQESLEKLIEDINKLKP